MHFSNESQKERRAQSSYENVPVDAWDGGWVRKNTRTNGVLCTQTELRGQEFLSCVRVSAENADPTPSAPVTPVYEAGTPG